MKLNSMDTDICQFVHIIIMIIDKNLIYCRKVFSFGPHGQLQSPCQTKQFRRSWIFNRRIYFPILGIRFIPEAVRVVSRLVNSNFVYAKLLQQFSLLILLQFYFATKSLTDFVTFSKCNKIAY